MIETLINKLAEDTGRRAMPLPFEKMETYLKEQEVDGRTARIYVEKAEEDFKDKPVIEDEEVASSIRKMIENQINIYGPVNKNKVKVVAFVGPTGVGKTTTLAKLGWELHKNDRTVGFITTDTFRSGAKEQLEGLAQLMETEVIVAKGAKELNEAIQYYKNVNQVDHILIDTVGRNPMASESIEAVKEYLEISKPDLTCLVLSSTSKVKDLQEIIARFKPLKVDGLIFTKLDETFNVGSVLNVFNFTKLPVVYVTDGQDITRNIYAPTKKLLSEKIMKKDTQLKGKVIA
jgi:flagellar biosynthesis protein FlhF